MIPDRPPRRPTARRLHRGQAVGLRGSIVVFYLLYLFHMLNLCTQSTMRRSAGVLELALQRRELGDVRPDQGLADRYGHRLADER